MTDSKDQANLLGAEKGRSASPAPSAKSSKALEALSFLESLETSLGPSASQQDDNVPANEAADPNDGAAKKTKAAEALSYLEQYSSTPAKASTQTATGTAIQQERPVGGPGGQAQGLDVGSLKKSFFSFSKASITSLTNNIKSVANASPDIAQKLSSDLNKFGTQLLDTVAPPIPPEERATAKQERDEHSVAASPAAQDTPRIRVLYQSELNATQDPSLAFPLPASDSLLWVVLRKAMISKHFLTAAFKSLAVRDLSARLNPDESVAERIRNDVSRLIRVGEHPRVVLAVLEEAGDMAVNFTGDRAGDDLVRRMREVATGLGEKFLKQGQAISRSASAAMGTSEEGAPEETKSTTITEKISSINLSCVSTWSEAFTIHEENAHFKLETVFGFEEVFNKAGITYTTKQSDVPDQVPHVSVQLLARLHMTDESDRIVATVKIASTTLEKACCEVSATLTPDFISASGGGSNDVCLVIARNPDDSLEQQLTAGIAGKRAALVKESRLAELLQSTCVEAMRATFSLVREQ